MSDSRYESLVERLRRHADLAAALRLLEWDQETYMPSGAIELRGRQIGTLSEILHRQQTDPQFLDLVDSLAADLDRLSADEAVDVRETKWRLDRERALDPGLVQRRAALHSAARAVWVEAREQDNFQLLAPYLEKIVATEREVAAAIDSSRPAYDVLLEAYEPGASTRDLHDLFHTLRTGLQPLIERLTRVARSRPQGGGLRGGNFPVDRQRRLNRLVAERLGFDFRRGRIDEAVHPFCTDIGNDLRITTRYDEHDLGYALYSTIHETGHALYEQGLDPQALGLPRGTACSLGVHESQSRLWENLIGRSEAFWRFLRPLAGEIFPEIAGRSLGEVLRAVNDARPSLIRTEADEITYNMHIILRFELEQAMIEGDLQVADLPGAWREGMRRVLGIEPHNDRDGVLQDVHWSCGSIGYFPTYALGNVYAAQIVEAAETAVGPLGAQIEAGEFQELLGWLRRQIHIHGQRYRAPELIEKATGRPPSPAALLRHLERRVDWLEHA
jgi:carboxypeptidase Taq